MYQWLAITMFNGFDNAVIYRKYGTLLETKVRGTFMQILRDMGLYSFIKKDIFHPFAKYALFPNGNKCTYDFADEDGKSKGVANVKYIIFEEVDQFSINDFNSIVGSYRGQEGIRFILLFNPVSEDHWLKKVFFDEQEDFYDEEGVRIIPFKERSKEFHYTVHDNKFATSEDINDLKSLRLTDENAYRVCYLGLWGTISIDDPFLNAFQYNIHVAENVMFFPEYPLWISFDFGKQEYAIVGQHFSEFDLYENEELEKYFNANNRGGVTRLSKHSSKNSFNNIKTIIDEIVEIYGKDVRYIVTGDQAGGSDAYSKFAEINRVFEDHDIEDVYYPFRAKPRHEARRDVCNWSFNYYASNFKVDKVRCDTLIQDYQTVAVNEWGKIDKNDCIKYNKGHFLDADGYLTFHAEFMNYYNKNKGYVENTLYFNQSRERLISDGSES